MRMVPFHDRFPKVAEHELRILIISGDNKYNLPAGAYALLESYCNLPLEKCDCRRVFLNVLYGKNILATIGYGWEGIGFYANWFGKGNPFSSDAIIRDIKGPILELSGYNSQHSHSLLNLFIDQVMNEPMFISKLERHYHMFKGRS